MTSLPATLITIGWFSHPCLPARRYPLQHPRTTKRSSASTLSVQFPSGPALVLPETFKSFFIYSLTTSRCRVWDRRLFYQCFYRDSYLSHVSRTVHFPSLERPNEHPTYPVLCFRRAPASAFHFRTAIRRYIHTRPHPSQNPATTKSACAQTSRSH